VNFRHHLTSFAAAVVLIMSPLALAKEAVPPSELDIQRVYTSWRDGASFKRISEYFDGKENTGREIVLRTHPEQRTGFYFLVRVKNPGAARKVTFQLQLIEQGTPTPRPTAFPGELGAGTSVFQLGLTGPEWQDAKSQPVAWHLQVLGDDGRVLVTEKSYLWEKPASK
jgi:hypothetical protein